MYTKTTFEYIVDRYYYTPERRFEQSIDVYLPVVRRRCSKDVRWGRRQVTSQTSTDNNNKNNKVPVVLVMGSGWMGHRPYVYRMTNWWNSSAPKQICQILGHPCVSIRHSGAFFFGNSLDWRGCSSRFPSSALKRSNIIIRSRPLSLVVAAVVICTALFFLVFSAPTFLASKSSPLQATAAVSMAVITVILVLLLLWIALYSEGQGAAGIEEMLIDVSKALEYIDLHASDIGISTNTDNSAESSSNNNVNEEKTKHEEKKTIPIVFGGYSSGAHVAATLLTASSLSPLLPSSSPSWAAQQSPKRDDYIGMVNSSSYRFRQHEQRRQLEHIKIVSVLYISGVLDVPLDSRMMTLLTTVAFGKKPLQVPSPLRILQSEIQTNRQKVDDYRDNNSNNKCNQNTIPPPPPASLSPSSIGLPPHVLIGCQREVFGWSILDSAFCSAEYANALKSWRTMTPTNKINGNNRNADFVKLILLGGWLVNHWSILSSLELRETLRIVLADISNTNQDSIYDD